MEKQFFGSEAPLKKSPLNVEHDGSTGKPEEQFLGSREPLSYRPAGLHLNEDIREGARQTLGSEAPLSFTPRKGWESASTPMSDRAVKQSE